MRRLPFAALALALAFAVPNVASAKEETVTCKDGTTSKAGQGACSHHGGVDKNAQVTCKDGTKSKPGKGACSHHGGIAKEKEKEAGTPGTTK